MSKRGGGMSSPDEGAQLLQLLQAQGAMQSLLLEGYSWSFKQCTTASSGPALSAKEKRCVQQGVATYIDARSHVGQSLASQAQAGGSSF